MEVRYHKFMLEVEEPGDMPDLLPVVEMKEGTKMSFNIGVDDDDGADLAIQYWWANRIHPIVNSWNEMLLLSDDELKNGDYLNPDSDAALWELGVNAAARTNSGGTGDIIFGPMAASVLEWNLF
jgi:hypothetical protein